MNLITLFELNPSLDRGHLAQRFAVDKRVQVRDFLTLEAAHVIRDILAQQTPWGLAWNAGSTGPYGVRREMLSSMSAVEKEEIGRKITAAMAGQDYAFLYSQYPILDAYMGKWRQGSPHDLLLEHINAEPFLDLVREVTGSAELVKADAQATLYGPNQFLAIHDDSHVREGWKIAYVMNFCVEPWRPDWGGYLMFYDEEGDVVGGFRPRFNALNLFQVPQKHNVTYVPPFAPVGRFAITGWFRDR